MTPPTMKIRKMMSCAAANPLGIASKKYQGRTSTEVSAVAVSKVPATTIERFGFSGYGCLSKLPCGTIYTSTCASRMTENMSTRESIEKDRLVILAAF